MTDRKDKPTLDDPISNRRQCLTPDARYEIYIEPSRVSIAVSYPPGQFIDLYAREALALERELHDAVEAVLARRWHLLEGAK